MKKCDTIIASKLKLYEGITGDRLVTCQAFARNKKEAIAMIQEGYDHHDDSKQGSFTFTSDDVREVKPVAGFHSYSELAM